MGSSLNITWTCGPDTSIIEGEVCNLQMGSFDSMEDIYEYSTKDPMVIDGYIIEQQKYVSCEQEIPECLIYKLAKCLSDTRSYVGVPKLEGADKMNENFEKMFGGAWNWRQMLYQSMNKVNFHTDDYENIKIVNVETDEKNFNNLIFTYEYKGEQFNTINNLKIEKMSTTKFEIGQSVKVTYNNGTNYTGIIIAVKEKSLQVNVEGKTKMVMLSIAKVEIVEPANPAAKQETKATEQPKEKKTVSTANKSDKVDTKAKNAKKGKVKNNPFYAFLLSISNKIEFPEAELELAKAVILSEAGNNELKKVAEKVKTGGYDTDLHKIESDICIILKAQRVDKTKTEEPKDETKTEEPKADPELHPLVKKITDIADEKDFNTVKKEIEKAKAELYSKKKKFVVKLHEYVNGNIYVINEEDGKKYFALPQRFSVHFDIKK